MVSKKIVLVDTDILIKVFRGDSNHRKHLNDITGRIAISTVTVLELYQGVNSKRRKYDLEKQLRAYRILSVNEKISLRAVSFVKKYSPDKQLLPPDSLIAATAVEYGLELYTDNKIDFNFISGLRFYKT
jgi:predicted nucleic acid-binding protein